MVAAVPQRRRPNLTWIFSVLAIVTASVLVGSLIWFFMPSDIIPGHVNHDVDTVAEGYMAMDDDDRVYRKDGAICNKCSGMSTACSCDSLSFKGVTSVLPLVVSNMGSAADFTQKHCLDLIADKIEQSNNFIEVMKISSNHVFMKPKHPDHLFCSIYLDKGMRTVLSDLTVVRTSVLLQTVNKGKIVSIYTTNSAGEETMTQLFKRAGSDRYCVHDDYWQLMGQTLPFEPLNIRL
ncbi:putative integral membrane protein [Babesia bovis T2Bo]|uniref:Membrane protein, putative n=1 Tax=Babesia bovis TaxID=5865 RepID=A7ANM4_BABBO|nr:putative integral membrane protein [Babesia bovis T2Bo]EDO08158.1 putative integral membrane protein [Babesia bovis T2Bo]|eukprot:XP_001611726.1 membrane protein [Babesia bovis T2Bo]